MTSEAGGGIGGRLQSYAGLDGDIYLRGGGGPQATGVLNTGATWEAVSWTYGAEGERQFCVALALIGALCAGGPEAIVAESCWITINHFVRPLVG